MSKTLTDTGAGGKLDWFPKYVNSRGCCGFLLRFFSYIFVFFGNVSFLVVYLVLDIALIVYSQCAINTQ